MKCREAREIINSLIDGEKHPLEDEARAHVSQCASCMEWQASMERTISQITIERLPDVDFSAAIMSHLPERHPASQRVRFRITRRALAWIAACWATGLMAFLAVVLALSPERTGGLVIKAYELSKAAIAMVGYVFGILRVVAEAMARVPSQDFKSLFVFIMVDSIILAAIAAIWLRRKKAHGLFMVMS